jgi:large subunit ribosomal protein L18Ae
MLASCLAQIFEKKPTTIKNFGLWIRHQSRSGYHNMYKEYRDVTLNGAVEQMYSEMASRHRVRFSCIQVRPCCTPPQLRIHGDSRGRGTGHGMKLGRA